MKRTRPILLGAGVTILAVMFFFRPQPSSKTRLPSSIELPVTLLCAGRADLDNTFTFASANGDLRIAYDDAGVARVTGPARISWRADGDQAEFDGITTIEGTRSSDGRIYDLQASMNGVRLALRLEQGDAGALTVTDSAHEDSPRRFHSRCQDDPSGY